MSEKRKNGGRPCFSIPEIYGIAVKAFRSAPDLKKGRKTGLLPETLQERIMLAVTAVNNCPMCSYAHTEMALKAGLAEDEIRGLISGEFPDIPDEDMKAVLFAQNYAEHRGRPEKSVWSALEDAYGKEKARSILAAVRAIMFGNSIGIVLSSVKSRVRGEGGDPRSSVLYEITALTSLLLTLPLSIVQALVCNILKIPVISFHGSD